MAAPQGTRPGGGARHDAGDRRRAGRARGPAEGPLAALAAHQRRAGHGQDGALPAARAPARQRGLARLRGERRRDQRRPEVHRRDRGAGARHRRGAEGQAPALARAVLSRARRHGRDRHAPGGRARASPAAYRARDAADRRRAACRGLRAPRARATGGAARVRRVPPRAGLGGRHARARRARGSARAPTRRCSTRRCCSRASTSPTARCRARSWTSSRRRSRAWTPRAGPRRTLTIDDVIATLVEQTGLAEELIDGRRAARPRRAARALRAARARSAGGGRRDHRAARAHEGRAERPDEARSPCCSSSGRPAPARPSLRRRSPRSSSARRTG